MARRMVVVPYDWVKGLLSNPPEVQKKLDENDMTRQMNLRFPDDFGKQAEPQPDKPEIKIEDPPKAPPEEKIKQPEQKESPTFSEPFADIKLELYNLKVITADGAVIGDNGKVVQRSHIDDIFAYLSGSRKRSAVAATQIKKKLLQHKIHTKGLIKPPIRQSGKGWIRV